MRGMWLTLMLLGVSWPGFADDRAIYIAAAPLSGAALEETGLDLALGYQTLYAPDFSFVFEYGYGETSLPGTLWYSAESSTTVQIQKAFWGGRQNLEAGFVIWGGISAFLAKGDFDLRHVNGWTYSRSFISQGLFAESGIGHQWDIHESLLVGIDWLAIAWPLTSTLKFSKPKMFSTENSNLPRGPNINERDDVQYAIQDLTQWRALRVTVGYAF
jgi:hypothetical protein